MNLTNDVVEMLEISVCMASILAWWWKTKSAEHTSLFAVALRCTLGSKTQVDDLDESRARLQLVVSLACVVHNILLYKSVEICWFLDSINRLVPLFCNLCV